MTNDVGQVVVDGLLLRRQLGEEEMREIADPLVLVLKALCHLAELTLDLNHPVENQVGEDHEGVLLDRKVFVVQSGVETIAVLVHDRREAHGDVAESDNDVASHGGFSRRLKDFEEHHEMLLAELSAHAHELAQRERRGRFEHRVLTNAPTR